jgi:hypothetical protein
MADAPNAQRDAEKVKESLDQSTGDRSGVQNIVQQQLTEAQKSFGTNEQGFKDYQQKYTEELQKSGALPELAADWTVRGGAKFSKDGQFGQYDISAGLDRNSKTPYENLMLTGLQNNYDALKKSSQDGERGWFGSRKQDPDTVTRADVSAFLDKTQVERHKHQENQQVQALVKPLMEGNPPLYSVLDSVRNGKSDGNVSKEDLEIYRRTQPADSAQAKAVDTILKGWDDRKDPNFDAVQRMRGATPATFYNEFGGSDAMPAGNLRLSTLARESGIDPAAIKSPEDLRTAMAGPQPVSNDVQAASANQPEDPARQPDRQPEGQPEAQPARPEVDPALITAEEAGKVGKVGKGEGYYQVAKRLLEMTGESATHEQIRALTRAMKAANNGKNVLSTRDNLADLLSSPMPGQEGRTLIDLLPKKKLAAAAPDYPQE